MNMSGTALCVLDKFYIAPVNHPLDSWLGDSKAKYFFEILALKVWLKTGIDRTGKVRRTSSSNLPYIQWEQKFWFNMGEWELEKEPLKLLFKKIFTLIF